MQAPERSSNGRRYYTEIDFIRRLKETAMPLKQIKQYAVLPKQGEITFAEHAQLLTEYRDFLL